MVLLIRSVGFFLAVLVQGTNSIGSTEDANSLLQERISYEIDVSRVNPYDGDAIKEMNKLSDMLLGQPYESMILKEFAKKKKHSKHSRKMSLFDSTSVVTTEKLMEKSFTDMHSSFSQYKEAVVISNLFSHFDTSGDNKIDRKEMDAILSYFGKAWNDTKVNNLMHDLDYMVADELVQPSEFFFWFTWPEIDHSVNFKKTIKKVKEETARFKSGFHSQESQDTSATSATDTIALQSSDIPDDPAEVMKIFGRFTQFQDVLRILFFFKTFDTNWDNSVSKKELTDMVKFVEPGIWSLPEVASLMVSLDVLTKDQNIQLNEWFYWFTPDFADIFEPAIHLKADPADPKLQ